MLFTNVLLSQQVTFVVSPANAFVRVNGQVLDLSKKNTLELAPGTYEMEFWAPNFDVEKEMILVEATKPNIIRKGMKNISARYENFKAERSKYVTKKFGRGLIDFSVVGATLFIANASLQTRKTGPNNESSDIAIVQREIDANREIAETSINPNSIARARVEYTALTAEYAELQQERNGRILLGSVATAIGTGLAVFYFAKLRKQIERPVLETNNPFVQNVKPSILPSFTLGRVGGQAGFTLTF